MLIDNRFHIPYNLLKYITYTYEAYKNIENYRGIPNQEIISFT